MKKIVVKNQILCVLYDAISETYGAPTLFINDNVAVRSFVDLLENDIYSKHKADYSLVKIAEYDSKNGAIYPMNAKILMRGAELGKNS